MDSLTGGTREGHREGEDCDSSNEIEPQSGNSTVKVRSKRLRGGASRRDYWQGVLARHAESGLSIKTFCTRERISYQNYFLWKRKFRDEPGRLQGEVTFAPVTVVADRKSV